MRVLLGIAWSGDLHFRPPSTSTTLEVRLDLWEGLGGFLGLSFLAHTRVSAPFGAADVSFGERRTDCTPPLRV